MPKTIKKDPPEKKSDKPKIKRSNNGPINASVATKIKKTRGILNTNAAAQKNQTIENMDADDDDDRSSVSSKFSQAHSNNSTMPFVKNQMKQQQKKLKPICVTIKDQKIIDIKKSIMNLKLEKEFTLKVNSNEELQIVTNSKNDKLKVLESLQNGSENLEYHTFTEREDKNLVYVLKKHYHVDPTEMLTMLQANKCPATSVQFLNNNPSNPSYTVNFPKNSINLVVLRTQFKIIDHSVVKWENFNNKKKKITQCHKCQRFGHTARNCGHKYRCVKCIEDHLPGNCKRTTKEGSPSCVNCKKDHAANNSKCEVLMAYKVKLDALKKPKIVPDPRKFVSTQAPWANNESYDSNFPILSNNNNLSLRLNNIRNSENPTFSDDTNLNNDNQPNEYNDFRNIQKSFSSIPNISETMNLFRELTEKLKNTSCQKTRLSILIEYTMP